MSLGLRGAVSAAKPEDPLLYLPRKNVVEYARGMVVFDRNQPATGIYLVVRGRVKVTAAVDNSTEMVVDVYTADEFFGESGLIQALQRGQRAVTLDACMLMYWTTAEIEEAIEKQPRLGLAIMQTLVKRTLDQEQRLEDFALHKTPQRVAKALLRFTERMGSPAEDGSFHLPPLTHETLAEYVGTSREIVTFQMNQLRRLGFVRYSRRGIDVYAEALRQNVDKLAAGPEPAARHV